MRGPYELLGRLVPTRVSATDPARDSIGARGGRLVPIPGMGRAHKRSLYMVPGFGCGVMYRSFLDTIVNVEAALLERVFLHEIGGVFTSPKIPSGDEIVRLLAPFALLLKKRARQLTPIRWQDFPAMFYRGRRLCVYQRAVQALVSRGGVQKADSYLSTFLKHEKIADSAKRAVPRVISPRKPTYNVAVGCYIRPIEHLIYEAIADIFGRPTVMKGYNSFQQGGFFHSTWGRFRDPVAVGLDASRFDQHVSEPMLEWEHHIYRYYYPGDNKLAWLLKCQIENHGFVRCHDGGLKYVVRGGRCSGDMNTALGNCLLMCSMVHELCRYCGMLDRCGTRVALFNNGDDCILMGERADVTRLVAEVPSWFDRFGFVMKVEAMVDRLEKVSFCQTQPVYDGTVWRMVRDPRVTLSKDAVIVNAAHATRFLSNHLLQVAQCGLALTSGLPLLQAYYQALGRGQRVQKGYDWSGVAETGFGQLARGLASVAKPVSAEARVSFYHAFGILPEVQQAAERHYEGMAPMIGGQVHRIDNPQGPMWW